jgi:hypothetical protein
MAYPLPQHYLIDGQGQLSVTFESIRAGKPFHALPVSIYQRELYVGCLGNPAVVNPGDEFDSIVQKVFLRLDFACWESLELALHAFFADAC